MRRFILLLIILAACLAFAPAALAAPSGHDAGAVSCWFDFGLSGTVTAVDADAGVLTVAVERGSEELPPTLDVEITDETSVARVQRCERTPIALSDVAVGDQVTIFGFIDDSADDGSGDAIVYTAAFVAVHAPCFGLVGTVTAVDAENGLLTVKVDEASGDIAGEIQIVVTDDTRIVESHHDGRRCDPVEEPLTLADVSVGDGVGVWGVIDNSGDTPSYTAQRVCIRVPRFGLVGEVEAVDAEGGVLTVAVDHASGDLSGSLDVTITAETELIEVAEGERTDITLADVAEGDVVAVFGTVDASTGTPVYTAHVVLDGVSADWMPRPRCTPGAAAVRAGDAQKGDKLRLRVRLADSMPGCATAAVTVLVKNASGRTMATRTVAALAVNQSSTVSVKLGKALHRGRYKLVATSVDWAGNRQARAASARLTVK